MKCLVVVPSRMASQRFPGKPLVDLCGKPMIQWVVEAARRAEIGDVVVATPDLEIQVACARFHTEAVLTRHDHPSGTDRIAELSEHLIADVYVNVQGDEPLIDPESIKACVNPLLADQEGTEPCLSCLRKGEGGGKGSAVSQAPITHRIDMSSLYSDCPEAEADNPAVVKVVSDQNGFALYFSRYAIPYPRAHRQGPLKRHVGIYAYRREVVQAFARWPQTPLEQTEGLEQLRFLENGIRIKLSPTAASDAAVDIPAQAEEVRRILESRREPKSLRNS